MKSCTPYMSCCYSLTPGAVCIAKHYACYGSLLVIMAQAVFLFTHWYTVYSTFSHYIPSDRACYYSNSLQVSQDPTPPLHSVPVLQPWSNSISLLLQIPLGKSNLESEFKSVPQLWFERQSLVPLCFTIKDIDSRHTGDWWLYEAVVA